MLDDNATRARAIIESTWDQDVNGDSQCNNQGVSWGLLQVKDRLPRGCAAGPHESAYPDVFISTANNLNYALAWVVACYRGDMSEWIPNDFMADSALRMRHCTGLWFSGTWRRGNSGYLANYDTALANKPWLGASFPSWNVSGVCRTIDCDTLPASQDQVPDDTTPPSIPADLTADVVSTSRIDLSWRASMDDVGVTGYRLERCQGASCTDFAEIAQPSGTSFSNTGLVAGTAYRYRVHAADAAGNLSEYSDIVSATTNNGGAVTAGLVAHWQFDANADDGVGANHGTLLNGALTTPTNARIGSRALLLDGVNDYVRVPDSGALDGASAWTVSMWVRPTRSGAVQKLAYKRHSAAPWFSWMLEFDAQRRFYFEVRSSGSAGTYAKSGVYPVNAWYHVVATWQSGQAPKLYVDGVLDTRGGTGSALSGSMRNSHGELALGSWGGGNFFQGRIDDVRLYSRTLAASEVSALFSGSSVMSQVFDERIWSKGVVATSRERIRLYLVDQFFVSFLAQAVVMAPNNSLDPQRAQAGTSG